VVELLIIKSEEGYIRCNEGGYHACSLDKASVFPLSRLDQARRHLAVLTERGFPRVRLRKLVLTELPFEP
jgi:hypothetical protein